jgi:hypothetical protein
MTVIELVNKVLKRLREGTVVTVNETEYSALIGEFISDVHSECVEAHDWSSMNHFIDVDIVPGQREYNLGELVGNGGNVPNDQRPTNNDSLLIFDKNNRPMAFLFDDEDDAMGEQIIACSMNDLDYLYQSDRALDNSEPYHMSLSLAPENEGWMLYVWPLPQEARLIRVKFWTPPLILGDGEDDNTEVLLPWRPVYLGALRLALNERGEEIGEPGNMAEQRYYKALSSAIEADLKLGERTNQYEMRRD